jgi:hypothetical protein
MASLTADAWDQVNDEMIAAQLARDSGNEGKARVCARRALCKAIFLSGLSTQKGLSAIQVFVGNKTIPDEIRNHANSFLERVDETHQLKSGIDLIQKALEIISYIRERKI